ncbi:MAG: hypothetical protein JXA21_02215 [Anaerolineae bacterium]|nr:hypothetical protein [Anaerolineae bacterium]
MTKTLKKWRAAGTTLGSIALLLALSWFFSQPAVGVARNSYQNNAPLDVAPLNPAQAGNFAYFYQTPIYCSVATTTTDSTPTGNHDFGTAAMISNYVDQSLLTISPAPPTTVANVPVQPDFYRIDNALINYRYTIQAIPDFTTNYNLGIIVYDGNYTAIFTDTDTSNNSATASFVAFNQGPYFIEVFQVSAQCTGRTYDLVYSSPLAPTPTNTPPPPTSTSTPRPTAVNPTQQPPSGFDQYEPNFDFDTSTLVAVDVTYSLNFIPWGQWSNDNDFFRIWVKPGLRYTCETSDLGPGVDPNMIFYSAANLNSAVGSNDDISLTDFNSRVSFFSTYEGYLYILVGQGDRMKPQDTTNSTYKLKCTMTAPGATATLAPGVTPTAVPDKNPIVNPTTQIPTTSPPTDTPPAETPLPTETPSSAALTVNPLATPTPATPVATPTGFRTFRVLVYFDNNRDGQPGAGEGIPGFFVRTLAPETNTELARGYTDEQGQLSFTVPTVGTVRVVVPLLGFDRMVETAKSEVDIRISPPTLPDTIP